MSLDNDTLYRVSLDPIKNTVQISCIGMDRVDNSLDDTYLSVDDLPQWVQERIALLMMTDPTPPTVDVEGVGRRIDQYTFWICDKKGWEMNFCIARYNNGQDDYDWSLSKYGYPDGAYHQMNPNKPLVEVRRKRLRRQRVRDLQAMMHKHVSDSLT